MISWADPAFPVATFHGPIGGSTAEPGDLRAYAALFVFEFGLYPPELVRRAGVRRVILCEGLSFSGKDRNAVPDYQHDTLYLDVTVGTPGERSDTGTTDTYQRKVLHHEFFHFVDLRDDGSVYRDDSWEELNPPGFRYEKMEYTAPSMASSSLLTQGLPGFLTPYSTNGVEEDKAEIFAHLFVTPGAVHDREAIDPVLRAKVHRMRSQLREFCPELDSDLWRRVAAARGTGE